MSCGGAVCVIRLWIPYSSCSHLYASWLSGCSAWMNGSFPKSHALLKEKEEVFAVQTRMASSSFLTLMELALYATAELGFWSDKNGPPGSYQKPYSSSSFQATQRLQWECSNYQNGAYQRFVPDITITRSIRLNGSTWQYNITKSGASATINLP